MSIKDEHIKFLGFIVSILLVIISSITAWHTCILVDLPQNYVMLERYNHDDDKNQITLKRIESKLDRLIMSNLSSRK